MFNLFNTAVMMAIKTITVKIPLIAITVAFDVHAVLHTCALTHTHACIYIGTEKIHSQARAHAHAHAHAYTHACARALTHMCVYIYLSICMCVCMCVPFRVH